MTYPVEKLANPNPWLFGSRPNRGDELVGVMLHATRSSTSDGDDGPRTVDWMKNPTNGSASEGWGSSCDEVIHEDGKRTLINPDYRTKEPRYGAGFGDVGTWSAGWFYYQIEIAQGNVNDKFSPESIESLAERTRELALEHSFTVVRIPFLEQTGTPPRGACTHEESANGMKYQKSDPGLMFPWATFLALTNETPPEEDDMNIYIRVLGNPTIYKFDGARKVAITAAAWTVIQMVAPATEKHEVTQETLDGIPDL